MVNAARCGGTMTSETRDDILAQLCMVLAVYPWTGYQTSQPQSAHL